MAVRRILVLGATGGIGRQVVLQATAAGLEVTALVRGAEGLPETSRPIRVVTGDIRTDLPAVRKAYEGQDAVISALGVGKSFKPAGLMADACPRIVAAMQAAGVRRLVFTSAFGVGPTWPDLPLLPRFFAATLLRQIYADKAQGERAIVASGLDWTIVYAVGLTNGPRTGGVRVGEHLRLSGFPTISRADVAAVLLQQLDDSAFVRKGILVAS